MLAFKAQLVVHKLNTLSNSIFLLSQANYCLSYKQRINTRHSALFNKFLYNLYQSGPLDQQITLPQAALEAERSMEKKNEK